MTGCRARSRCRSRACTVPMRRAWRCVPSIVSTRRRKASCCTTRTCASDADTASMRVLLARRSFRRMALTFCAGGPEQDHSAAEFKKYGRNRLAEGKLPACAEMCSTKALLGGDGDVVADIYRERVLRRGKGSEVWGWGTAYGPGAPGAQPPAGAQGRKS